MTTVTHDTDTRSTAQFIADAYAENKNRSLQALAEPLIYGLDNQAIREALTAVCGIYGDYNDYRPDRVIRALGWFGMVLEENGIALNVRVGRDYSPVIFLEFVAPEPESAFLASPEFLQAVQALQGESLADECFLAYGKDSQRMDMARMTGVLPKMLYRKPEENAQYPSRYIRLWWD